MKFLLDAQLPSRLTKAPTRTGHKAAPRDIWKYAAKHGFAVVTKDADFAAMRAHAAGGPAVVWLRLGNVSNDKLIEAFMSVLPEVAAAIEAREGIVEVR